MHLRELPAIVIASRFVLLVVLVSAAASACAPRPKTHHVVIELPCDLAPALVRISPENAIVARRNVPDAIEIDAIENVTITVDAPTACPETLGPGQARAALRFVIDAPLDTTPVGYDQPFRVDVRRNCERAAGGRIVWRLREGDVQHWNASSDGLALEGRTIRMPALEKTWGIVPISPRTSGAASFEVAWSDERGARLERAVRVHAAARATGVSSIAVGQEVWLGGEGWHVIRATPNDVTPRLEPYAPGLFRFSTSRAAQIVLMDGSGKPLSIRTGLHERVPLDCGRSDCHRATTENAQTSPMTHVLRNALEGNYGPYDATCAVPCHATGEPGLDDRGFSSVASILGWSAPTPHAGAWDEVPRSLRRLGGVTCTSCHGPAAIPEPTARFAILRADVCATCHDAPPRYDHVAAWRSSAMARADRDNTAASDPSCQRCHTTAGFLRTVSPHAREDAPRAAGPLGIACAACHAPHSAHGASLVREVSVDDRFASLEAKSRVCVPCHDSGAAAVWAGRRDAPSPHRDLSCTSCHMAPSGDDRRGAGHAFRADPALCRTCHAAGVPNEPPALRAWRASTNADSAAAHVARMRSREGDADARALAEDRAAWVHNATFARAVLGDRVRVE